MENICFYILVFVTVCLSFAQSDILKINIEYIGTAHIYYNDSHGFNYTLTGKLILESSVSRCLASELYGINLLASLLKGFNKSSLPYMLIIAIVIKV